MRTAVGALVAAIAASSSIVGGATVTQEAQVLEDKLSMFQSRTTIEHRLSQTTIDHPEQPWAPLWRHYDHQDDATGMNAGTIALLVVFITLGALCVLVCMWGGFSFPLPDLANQYDELTKQVRSLYTSGNDEKTGGASAPEDGKTEETMAVAVRPRAAWSSDYEQSDESSHQRRSTTHTRATWTPSMSKHTISDKVLVMTMLADVMPVGFLPVTAGIHSVGYVPGLFLLVFFLVLCTYTMWLIALNCEMTGTANLERQWGRLIGTRSRWVPLVATAVSCFGDNLAFASFYGNLFSSALQTIGIHLSRRVCCIIFSVFPALPLSLLKSFEALAPSSFFAVAAVLYTLIVMCIRCADGSYRIGGVYYHSLRVTEGAAVPVGTHDHLANLSVIGVMRLMNTLAMSFMAHYNGCKYYRELKASTPQRFGLLSGLALLICAVAYAVSCSAGFRTFGDVASENILENYSEKDTLVNIARFAIGLSLLASYPLTFSGLRESTLTLLTMARPQYSFELSLTVVQDCVSCVMVSLVTLVAVVLPDEGIVVGLVGSICGSAVIFLVPTVLQIALKSGDLADAKSGTQSYVQKFVFGFGVFIMVLGSVTILFFR